MRFKICLRAQRAKICQNLPGFGPFPKEFPESLAQAKFPDEGQGGDTSPRDKEVWSVGHRAVGGQNEAKNCQKSACVQADLPTENLPLSEEKSLPGPIHINPASATPAVH